MILLRHPRSLMVLSAATSSLVRIGCGMRSRWACSGVVVEQVLLGPDVALQRHDHLFADRVDRRVGHLRKELLEVVVRQARLVAQNRERGVVAHGADRVALLLDHRPQHELHRFGGVAERLHAGRSVSGSKPCASLSDWKLRQLESLLVEPLAVRALRRRMSFLSSSSGIMRPCSKSIRNMRPGLQAALVLHCLGRHRQHADFGRHDHAVVVREVVAAGTQAVAVEDRADDVPSVKAIDAGPSQGSMRQEWYS